MLDGGTHGRKLSIIIFLQGGLDKEILESLGKETPAQTSYAMEKFMKKLLISFVAITWVLYSAALYITDDACPSRLQLDSGAVSTKSAKDEVSSSCQNSVTKTAFPDSSEKRGYKYGSTDYIDELSITIDQDDQGY